MTAQNIPRPPGHDLVPISTAVGVPEVGTEVVGTVYLFGEELVVQIRPTRYQDVTGRRVDVDPEVADAPHPLTHTCLRYIGPLTGAARKRHFAILAQLSRPWWSPRRWLW